MNVAGRAALLFATCLSYGCSTAPSTAVDAERRDAGQYGWLVQLAGHCWHESVTGAEACWWFETPDSLYWFSRNAGVLLGCGRWRVTNPTPPTLDSMGWAEQPEDLVRGQRLTDDALIAVAEGSTPGTVMRRLGSSRFSIREDDDSRALVFERRQAVTRDDPAARRCIEWERQITTRAAEAVR